MVKTSDMDNLADKRRDKRVLGIFEISILPPRGEKINLKAYNYDISEGGIRCVIPRELIRGSSTHIKIRFPGNDEELIILGEIVWIRPWKTKAGFFECGIRFVAAGANERASIRRFVARDENAPA